MFLFSRLFSGIVILNKCIMNFFHNKNNAVVLVNEAAKGVVVEFLSLSRHVAQTQRNLKLFAQL